MDNIHAMAVFDCINNGHSGLSGQAFIKVVSFDNYVKKLSTSHEFHDQVEVRLVFVDVDQLDNVRVVNLLQNVDFILKFLNLLFTHVLLVNYFDSHFFSCRFLDTDFNKAESSLSDLFAKLVFLAEIIVHFYTT